MVERNEKGRIIRRYFIEMERQALQPKAVKESLTSAEPKTQKALPNGLTVDQQDAIKQLVKERLEVLPSDHRAKAAITCWSAIKSKFGVKTYKAVAPERFTQVISLLARLPLEGELVVDELDAAPRPSASGRVLLTFERGQVTASVPVPPDAFIIPASAIAELWDGLMQDFVHASGRLLASGRRHQIPGFYVPDEEKSL